MSVGHGVWSHKGRRYNVVFTNVSTLFIERQDRPNLVGGIARGKVDRLLGRGAFIKLPAGAMGYLETKRKLQPGDELLVQVSAYAIEDKAWPLKLVETDTVGSAGVWLTAPPALLERAGETNLPPLDADTLAERMHTLLQLDVTLPSGGRLRLGPTPALFAIDIDSGDGRPQAKELAQQILQVITTRNIGGQIVIDPLRDSSQTLLTELKACRKASPELQLTVHGLTRMGLIELSRPRLGPSLYEALDG